MCFGWGLLPFLRGRFFPGGIIVMILFTILVILAIIFTVNYVKKTDKKEYESAFDILKKKYASGEITKEEYEEKKQNIL